MKSSFLLMLALACAQRTPAPSPATTMAAASAQHIVLPDHFAVAVEVVSDDETRSHDANAQIAAHRPIGQVGILV